jgi:phosphatidate cytidylyltransferase
LVSLILAAAGSMELVRLIPTMRQPFSAVSVLGSVALISAHWSPYPSLSSFWSWVALALSTMVLGVATFREPGDTVQRIAMTIFIVTYLGVLPGFLIDLRMYQRTADIGTASLAIAIFVPKSCDIGAYFTGMFLGRHRMSPIISPKKTWEGAAGGLVFAALVALGINSVVPVIPGGIAGAIAFGVIIGIVAMVGDLFESMIKREYGTKDSGTVLPEFGGVLDIVDSIIFSAPVVFWWLRTDWNRVIT